MNSQVCPETIQRPRGDSGCLVAVVMIAASVTFFVVFVGLALSQLSIQEQHERCSASNIWLYVLLSILISCVVHPAILCFTPYTRTIQVNLCVFLTLGLWGLYECYSVTCVTRLRSTLLYPVATVFTWLYVALSVLTIVRIRYMMREEPRNTFLLFP